MVNTHLIKLQGQRLQDMLNSSLPPDQQLALQFSNGWLEKFCHRHSFKQQVAHGESGSVQQEVINQELPALRQLLQQYHPDDIFNADETGLFYNMPPNKTIASSPTSGLKKNKARISILFACNSSGTEKLDLIFIGHAQQPYAFKKAKPEQLGVHYFNNTKAWMTSSIFSTWLTSLDLHFLPPNTTSRIQPLDAGIIAAFKKNYRARQYQMALLESELGSTDIYKLDILQAMKLSQEIWKSISINTIKNCWRHTGLVDFEGEDTGDHDAVLEKELEATLKKLTEVTVHDVVSPPGEEEALAEIEDTEDTLETPSPPLAPVELDEGPESATGVVEEQLMTLKSAQDILAEHGLLTQQVSDAFSACKSCLTAFQSSS